MDIQKAYRTANKYLVRYENRDYSDVMGEDFSIAFQHDFLNAGFECDYLESYRKIYPGAWGLEDEPEQIDAISDMQTVGNTIFSVFRAAEKTESFTEKTRKWLMHALEHLIDLAGRELLK